MPDVHLFFLFSNLPSKFNHILVPHKTRYRLFFLDNLGTIRRLTSNNITLPVHFTRKVFSRMSNEQMNSDSQNPTQDSTKPKVLIGSQRNPEAYRTKPSIPAVDPQQANTEPKPETPEAGQLDEQVAGPLKAASFNSDSFRENRGSQAGNNGRGNPKKPPRNRQETNQNDDDSDDFPDHLSDDGFKSFKDVPPRNSHRVPVPSVRGKLADDLEDEFNAVFGDSEMEDLMVNVDKVASQTQLEPETKLKGKVLALSGEDVFFELGAREQGIVQLKQFKELPVPGQEWDVIVMKYLPEDGLYDLSLPLAAADVREWEQISEGMILNAKITGANTGGLECEVNKLRGFIPMGQIAVFRVEKPEEYIGQTISCVVLEVNPMRRNLILSRKVMLERERAELREKLLAELEVGQVREGLVRKNIDAGAFVDLGGVDGFIPIGALSWGRVRHPSDVLTEGSRIKVKITKMDLEANRISLTYRDDSDNPWTSIFDRFDEKTQARGKVTRLMDFGAFVELMPGVEGLVHISELAHKRVGQVSDVLKEGDWVDVFIQSIDLPSRRISLSIKQLVSEPTPDPVAEEPESEENEGKLTKGKGKKDVESTAVPISHKQKYKGGPLRGGTGSSGDGEKFGLKW